jgi:hypothetical protein
MNTASGPNPSAEERSRPPRRHWQASVRPHWTEIVLACALLAVGMAQVLIYLRQASIMQTQADIAAKQNEIAIAADRAVVNFHAIGQAVFPGYYDYTFKIGNDGSVTTANLSIAMDCVRSDVVKDEPFDLLSPGENNVVPDLIPPKREIELSAGEPSVPALAAAFPVSTGIDTLSNVRICFPSLSFR